MEKMNKLDWIKQKREGSETVWEKVVQKVLFSCLEHFFEIFFPKNNE
jgi:hypothetical protein